MTDNNITDLNGLIADINETEINDCIARGTLAEWCESWRQAASQCSITIFSEISALKDLVKLYRAIIESDEELW